MAAKTRIHSDAAPAAIGPYSQAVVSGGLLFASGQIPLDPATGELVTGDVDVQTRRAMDNLGAVLEAGGASWGSVLKTTIYMTDLSRFAEVNAVYAEYFDGEPPARATVQVAALPKGAEVEIDAVARVAT